MSAAGPPQGASPVADGVAGRQQGQPPASALARSKSLRNQLLHWLLVPLTLLFLADAIGSYIVARHLSDQVYDNELLEIAR